MPATRAYNSFKLDKTGCKITKTSSTLRLKDEIDYYREIQKTNLNHFFPRIFSSNTSDAPYSVDLEYYDYADLGLQMIDCELIYSEEYWEIIADKLVSILQDFQQLDVPVKNLDSKSIKAKMYVEKTLHYQKELVSNFDFFKDLNEKSNLIINKEKVLNFDLLWQKIEPLIDELLINNKPLSVIHGDMCFSNILCSTGNSIIKFIDPRGSFGARGIYGDPLYDVAKLTHSFDGCYEYIINDKFSLKKIAQDSYDFSFENKNHELIKKVFLKNDQFNQPAVQLIQGLIFIGMCSRHYDSLDRQIVMYLTGLRILNNLL